MTHRGLHVGVKKPHRIAPRSLGLVHRQVGVLEQLLNTACLLAKERNAHAQRGVVAERVQRIGHVQRGHYMVGHQRGFSSGLVDVGAEAFQEHHKFVSAKTRHRIGFTHTGPQAVCHLLQKVVAGVVPQRVIKVLEVVQIDEQQRAMRLRTYRCQRGPVQAVHQQPAVGQLGQHVVKRQPLDLAFCLLALCDVASHTLIAAQRTVGMKYRHTADRDPVHAAVWALTQQFQVPKRLVCVQHRAMHRPVVLGLVERTDLPACAAHDIVQRDAVDTEVARQLDEVALGIVLPVPVG